MKQWKCKLFSTPELGFFDEERQQTKTEPRLCNTRHRSPGRDLIYRRWLSGPIMYCMCMRPGLAARKGGSVDGGLSGLHRQWWAINRRPNGQTLCLSGLHSRHVLASPSRRYGREADKQQRCCASFADQQLIWCWCTAAEECPGPISNGSLCYSWSLNTTLTPTQACSIVPGRGDCATRK